MRDFILYMDTWVFLGLAALFVAAALFTATMVVSGVNLEIDNPGRNAERHIRENIDEIGRLVLDEMGDSTPLGSEQTIDCWEVRDPAQAPSEGYAVQKCRIWFGARPHDSVRALYTVIMKDPGRDPFAILRKSNHPVVGAYLDLDTVRKYPENRHIQLGESERE